MKIPVKLLQNCARRCCLNTFPIYLALVVIWLSGVRPFCTMLVEVIMRNMSMNLF